ncbi:hypothetical protein F5Y10DRAFT_20961 [Nemania abortiva]|nr:hypothetical protein F5Y10DRAFT_20961 [Nemania abortiva]
MATVWIVEPFSVDGQASRRRIYKTAMITERYSPGIRLDRKTRSQSASTRKSRSPSLITQGRDQEIFNTKHLQLLNVCDLALAFIACLIRQDKYPLPANPSSKKSKSYKVHDSNDVSSSGTNSSLDWDHNRKHLDDIFQSLASWRRDLDPGKPQLSRYDDGPLVSALDGVFTSFLTVGHQLTHLNLSPECPEVIDPVLLEVTNSLAKEVRKLEEERGIVNDYCAVCSDQEHYDISGYLDGVTGLIGDLIEDSKPLQLAMRRRASPGKRHSGRFDESTKIFYQEKLDTDSSSPKAASESTTSKPNREGAIAKPVRRTRTMRSEDNQKEAIG